MALPAFVVTVGVRLAGAAKALISLLGTLLTILTLTNALPFIPNGWHTNLGYAIGLISVILTYVVPNKKPNP